MENFTRCPICKNTLELTDNHLSHCPICGQLLYRDVGKLDTSPVNIHATSSRKPPQKHLPDEIFEPEPTNHKVNSAFYLFMLWVIFIIDNMTTMKVDTDSWLGVFSYLFIFCFLTIEFATEHSERKGASLATLLAVLLWIVSMMKLVWYDIDPNNIIFSFLFSIGKHLTILTLTVLLSHIVSFFLRAKKTPRH